MSKQRKCSMDINFNMSKEEPQKFVRANSLHSEETSKPVKEIVDNSVQEDTSSDSDSDSSESSESDEDEKTTPIHIKLPLHLDLDDLAGAIIDKNQRSKMNCIVEKKRAEEVVDHQPKTVRLPFGMNLTTDPRYEHLTGERMVIVCESGSLQRHMQPEPQEQEETVMIQPVVIPIGNMNPFQTHMEQQMRPVYHQMQPQQQQPMPHPMETLRPPMPGPIIQHETSEGYQIQPNPIMQQIAQQIIMQRMRMDVIRAQEEAQRAAQEEAAQRAAAQRPRQEETHEVPQAEEQRTPMQRVAGPQIVMAQRIPIPEEVLRQINRLPNHEVIVSVSEQEPEAQELRIIQHPRQSAQEMNGRQTYARGIPVHIPVPMMQEQPEQVAAATEEEMRPHFVQPRSVRSVDALLPKSEKRVKRCACDCAC